MSRDERKKKERKMEKNHCTIPSYIFLKTCCPLKLYTRLKGRFCSFFLSFTWTCSVVWNLDIFVQFLFYLYSSSNFTLDKNFNRKLHFSCWSRFRRIQCNCHFYHWWHNYFYSHFYTICVDLFYGIFPRHFIFLNESWIILNELKYSTLMKILYIFE